MGKPKYKTPSAGMQQMLAESKLEKRPSLGMTEVRGEIYYLDPSLIVPYKNQARKDFNDESLASLANSIAKQGILQPLLIVKGSLPNKFEVVSGERRLRAAQLAGLTNVPCKILEANAETDYIALIENIQRQDLNPFELAEAYQHLLDANSSLTQTELAENLGVSKQHLSEYLSFNRIDPVKKEEILKSGNITVRNIRNYISGSFEEQTIKTSEARYPRKATLQILRISYSNGAIKTNATGVKRLDPQEKQRVREELLRLVESL